MRGYFFALFLGGLGLLGAVMVATPAAASDRAKGWHCLRGDGSHPQTVEAIKDELRNPRSFEHVETRVTRIQLGGTHSLIMRYRGDGGLQQAESVYRNDDCSLERGPY